MDMLSNIEVMEQNTVKIDDMYFDPFKITGEPHDARVIFITHSHYDHFSIEDIKKIRNDDTIIIIPRDCFTKAIDLFDRNHIIIVEPNNNYTIGDTRFLTVPMYNIDKAYHPKENNWVGYLFKRNDITYYVVGDSDLTDEVKTIRCDVLFIPIGGTYTMDVEEAVEATRYIKPKYAIPTHYGTVVGNIEDGKKFMELLPEQINCKLYK